MSSTPKTLCLNLSLLTFFLGCAMVLSADRANAAEPVKYVRFRADNQVSYGVVNGDRVQRIQGGLFEKGSMTGESFALGDIAILTPTTPSKVLALAGNYQDHLGEKPVPKTPEPFFKPPSCLQVHEGEIVQPPDHAPVHFEAELVLVIGKRARNVSREEALDYVFGVTCGNDVSARDWQLNDVQWWRAKGSDTFGPCGPFVVTGLDYNALDMELRVNGEVKQKTNTRHMIHDVSDTVSFISQHITLEPGDLVFTGTTGKTQSLSVGDVVEVEIEGVGLLRNHVVAAR